MMRCYVHYESTSVPFTLLVTLSEQQLDRVTIADVIQLFLTKYKERHPQVQVNLCSEKWSLRSASRKSIEFPHKELVWRKVKNKEDLEIAPRSDSDIPENSAEPLRSFNEEDERLANVFTEHTKQNQLKECKRRLNSNSTDKDALLRIIDIYLQAGRSREAVHYANEAYHSHSNDLIFAFKLGQCHLSLGNGTKASDYLMQYSKAIRKQGAASTKEKHELQVALCRTYQLLDQRDMAIVIIEGVIRETQENIPALIEYAKLTYDLSAAQGERAMFLLLSCLVKDRANKDAQYVLSDLCKNLNGLELLEKASGEAWSSVPAVLLLAVILRDNGALNPAGILMKHALDLQPSSASSLLLYLHLLEVLGNYDLNLSCASDFFHANPSLGVADVACKHFSNFLNHFKARSDPASLSFGTPQGSDTAYTEDELQLLAVWCSVIKILFLKGELTYITSIIPLLLPLIKSKNLHKTNIRNEVAYFDCIHAVLSARPQPCYSIPQNAELVYFIGDSHCISPAWHALQFEGRKLVIHPVLATGIKIWHLRPQSNFYPRHNFFNAVKKIPPNSTVVLCLGEIDCRESLLRCVEDCIYDTLDAAIEHLLNIYLTVIEDLVSEYHWKILLHPVPPVLKITRPVVAAFNTALKLRTHNHPVAHFLDFESDLLASDDSLKAKFELDGTHLHPAYLEILQEKLQEISSE